MVDFPAKPSRGMGRRSVSKDPGLIPSVHVKKLAWWCPAVTPVQRQEAPRGSLASSRACLVSSIAP